MVRLRDQQSELLAHQHLPTMDLLATTGMAELP